MKIKNALDGLLNPETHRRMSMRTVGVMMMMINPRSGIRWRSFGD